jgi:hypothetical protein
MTPGTKTVIYPVRDLAQAKKLYGTLLGVAPSMDEAYYVAFSVGDQEVVLDPHGHSQGMTDLSATGTSTTSRRLSGRSSTLAQTSSNRSEMSVGGKLIAAVKDADGNTVGRTHPVTVTARLGWRR